MLSWLRRLGGSTDTTQSSASNPGFFAAKKSKDCICGDGNFDFEIVGESYHQDRLRQISAGRCERGERHVTFPCYLRFEINGHTHLPAVRVDASGGRTVGHFPAEQAEVYTATLHEIEQSGRMAECVGVLVGGYGDKPTFGVWLDFKPSLLHV